MRKYLKTIGLVVLVIAVIGYFWYAYFGRGSKVESLQTQSAGIVSVKIEPVKRGDIATEILLTGDVEADSKVTIFSKVPGRLEKLLVGVGSAVEKGSTEIALIDHISLEAQVNQARAQLKSIEVNLAQLAKEKERLDKLYKEGAVSQQAWEKVATTYQTTKAQKELAQAGLKLAEIQLAEATLWSTISGIISKKYVDEGDMISPNTRIVDIINIDLVKITVGLPEIYLTRCKEQTPVEIQADAYPSKSFAGNVSRIAPELDPRNRTAETEIIIPNPEHLLKPGMFARVRIIPEQNKNSLLVPTNAVVRSQTNQIVFVVDENSIARSRPVKTGLASATNIEIIEGLNEGQTVIIEGNIGLKDGTRVKIVERGE